MAEKRHEIIDGEFVVTHDNGLNPDDSPAIDRWSIGVMQIEKHMPQFETEISAGDKSAALDMVSDYKRQQERDRRNGKK